MLKDTTATGTTQIYNDFIITHQDKILILSQEIIT